MLNILLVLAGVLVFYKAEGNGIGTTIQLGGKKYIFSSSALIFPQAQEQCEKLKGNLADINTAEEQNLIATEAAKISKLDEWYIGLIKAQNKWMWTSGKDLTFENFASKQDTDVCVRLQTTHKWATQSVADCTGLARRFICELL